MKAERELDLDREEFFILDKLPELPARSPCGIYGTGHFAYEVELEKGCYLNRPDEEYPTTLQDVSLLPEAPDGRKLEGLFKRTFHLPAEIRRRNILVTGQIGSRKTQDIVIPVAACDVRDPTSSVIIVDGKGDLHQTFEPIMKTARPGRRIRVVNFTNQRRTTHGWNPFAANVDSESLLADARSFCAASHHRAYDYESPFWDDVASRLIAAIVCRLRTRRGPVCPADIHESLELPRKQLLKLLNDGPEMPFAVGLASFIESGSHNAETALSFCQGYFAPFQNADMAAVTSVEELRFQAVFKRPTVVILEISQHDLDQQRPLLNLFFSQLFREAARFSEMQAGCRLPVPLNVHLDDFAAAIGKIPGMGQHLNLLRSRDVRMLAAIQSLTQIEHFYGSEAGSVIAGFSTKIFKSPVELSDAEWASRHSGTCTVQSIEVTQEYDPSCRDGWQTVSRSIRPVSRPVLLPDEVRMAPDHFLYGRASTVVLPDVPVFQAWFRPAYETDGLAQPIAQARKRPRKKSLRRRPFVIS